MLVTLIAKKTNDISANYIEKVVDILKKNIAGNQKVFFYCTDADRSIVKTFREAFDKWLYDIDITIFDKQEAQQYFYTHNEAHPFWDEELFLSGEHLALEYCHVPYTTIPTNAYMMRNADLLIAIMDDLDKVAYII